MADQPPLGFEPPLVDADNPNVVKDGVTYDENGQPWQKWKRVDAPAEPTYRQRVGIEPKAG